MTGIDLVYIPKIERLSKNKSFLKRSFSDKELKEFKERNFNPQHIAASWGAKEALAKALGLGILKTGLKNVSLLHDEEMRPFIEYTGVLNLKNIEVTVSHEGDYCVVWVSAERIKNLRKQDTDKTDYGRLGIIAGSYGMTGAVCLSAMGAMRTGVGLCYIFSPSKIIPILQTKLTEPVFVYTSAKKYFKRENLSEVHEKSKILNAAVIGCGMSTEEGVSDFVRGFIKDFDRPLIIDADGLNALRAEDLKERKFPTVITPHIREFSRLTGIDKDEIQENRKYYASEFAKENGVITVLKGHRTVIADIDGEIYINETGNAGMATAGTGDVLSGMVGSFLSQGEEPLKAAIKAVRLHGLAGDYAALKYGEISMIASDLIEALPRAFEDYYE